MPTGSVQTVPLLLQLMVEEDFGDGNASKLIAKGTSKKTTTTTLRRPLRGDDDFLIRERQQVTTCLVLFKNRPIVDFGCVYDSDPTSRSSTSSIEAEPLVEMAMVSDDRRVLRGASSMSNLIHSTPVLTFSFSSLLHLP